MAEIIPTLTFREPTIPIIANTSARPMTSAEAVKSELLEQLCNSVQWQGSIEYMTENGITSVIEIGPGRVLTGLMRRIDRSVETQNIGDAGAVQSLTEQS
jgi:[acyl-carrier-protein] S-malonyltransferase